MTRFLTYCTPLLLVLLSALAVAQPDKRTDGKLRIVLAGDSTVTDNAGWGGAAFKGSFSDKVEIINLSKGGRSSKSFREEGRWDEAMKAQPDYVVIQFGHNDEPGKPGRSTDAGTEYRANMARYVDDARAAGAKPILVTPIARRQWIDGGHAIRSSLIPYVEVVRQIAAEKKVPIVDLHDRSIEVYLSLGKDGCEEFISPTKDDGAAYDGTHLNATGEAVFGPLMADALRQAVPELRGYRASYKPPTTRALSSTRPTTNAAEPPARATTPQGQRTITVAADGGGEFTRVQDAVAAAADYNADRTTIRIRPGVYYGQIVVPKSKANVTFQGDDAATTIITYALNVQDPIPAAAMRSANGNGVVVNGDDFRARHITFRNTSGDHGQAMALRLQGDRAVIENCRLLGWQDTLLVHSNRQYFRDCYIEGRVDFIYGGSTAVFERCTIHSKNGGYITAASTPEENPFGYVFLDCKLTGEGDPAYLGRPWRPYGAVAFIRCEIGSHIRPEGWHNWGKESNEKTARYAEYKCTGPGADRSKRVAWSRELTDDEAAKYTVKNVLAGKDNWDLTSK
jgi:pectinesterase